MRNSIATLLIWSGIVIAPNHLTAQQQFRHRISVQTGLFHYFFDESPILNIHYPTHYKWNTFNGMFMNSYGINYTFCINEKSNISIEFASFYQDYMNFANSFEGDPMILRRDFKTFGLSYTRELGLSKHFSLLYGGGVNYRWGNEAVILNNFADEITADVVQRKDIGLNAFTGINYNFSRRFYCYSKVDLLSFVYFGDKKQKAKFEDVYNAPQFPTRFDLSLKFGIGVKL